MSSRSPTAHFLGLELATDQLRAAVVDEQLDLVGVESVDFDSELPDFQCVASLTALHSRIRSPFDLTPITQDSWRYIHNPWRCLHDTR